MERKVRILVVDDDRRMAKTLVDIFTLDGYEAEAAYSGSQALEKMVDGYFDCVLTDIKMPDINGVELCKAIKARQSDLPIILMTAYSTDNLVKQGLKEGAIAALTKPLNINLLLSLFSSLRKQDCIVMVDNDPGFAKMLGGVLRERNFTVTELSNPDGITEVLRPNHQVVLLDTRLNVTGGLDILRQVNEKCPHLPVILVTDYREETAPVIEAALKLGAYTCLYKPFEVEELLRVLTEIRKQELSKALSQSASKRGQLELRV